MILNFKNMGIWGKLFGDREPSAEREQRAAEAQATREGETSAPESEVLSFPGSKEMLGNLMYERKKISNRTMAGSETLARQNAADLARIDKMLEAFKTGDLEPMRDFFHELKAKKEQAVAAAAKHLREIGPPSQKPEKKMTAEEKEEEKKKRARQEEIGDLKKKAETSRVKAKAAQKAGDFKKMQVFLKDAEDWEDMIGGLEVVDKIRAQQDLARAQEDPDLEKFTNFVNELNKEISARSKRRRAAA